MPPQLYPPSPVSRGWCEDENRYLVHVPDAIYHEQIYEKHLWTIRCTP